MDLRFTTPKPDNFYLVQLLDLMEINSKHGLFMHSLMALNLVTILNSIAQSLMLEKSRHFQGWEAAEL